jgi:uncharacterized NAD(P)/FAD-binding protein YdhS
LIKHSGGRPVEINIVERRSSIGSGVAYSTDHDHHLLNVPAAKMGAFPEDVEHFHRWLTSKGYEYAPGAFVPRGRYGEYLRETFAAAVKDGGDSIKLNVIDDEAVDVLTTAGEAGVLLDSGRVLPSDKVILAFGNFLPPDISSDDMDFTRSAKYFRNAWNPDNIRRIAADDSILVVGTGLTAVDNILALHSRGHRGRITAISTHGWLPAVHQHSEPCKSIADDVRHDNKVISIFKTIRRHASRAGNWRAVIDGLRPESQRLWQQLPVKEKRRFLRHLRRVWDISRHRMPPECMSILQKMQDDGLLVIERGKIRKIQLAGHRFKVTFVSKGRARHLTADAVINCVGSESNFSKVEFPLVRSLLERGEIEPDELGLGLNATPDGTIINRRKERSDVIFTLGTSLRGILWESTAMPEIRVQARNLALRLLAD